MGEGDALGGLQQGKASRMQFARNQDMRHQ
jgi:hypothetical protein